MSVILMFFSSDVWYFQLNVTGSPECVISNNLLFDKSGTFRGFTIENSRSRKPFEELWAFKGKRKPLLETVATMAHYCRWITLAAIVRWQPRVPWSKTTTVDTLPRTLLKSLHFILKYIPYNSIKCDTYRPTL